MTRGLVWSWVGVGALAVLAAACDESGVSATCALTGCDDAGGLAAPSGGGPVPAGYPPPITGGNFSLIVDGVPETDMGGLGAWLVDDPVPSNRYYQIDGETTIVAVPALDIGAYSTPTPHVNLTLQGNDLTFPDSLTVNIDGNAQGYVWGRLDGVLEGTMTAPFTVTGTFTARISP